MITMSSTFKRNQPKLAVFIRGLYVNLLTVGNEIFNARIIFTLDEQWQYITVVLFGILQ